MAYDSRSKTDLAKIGVDAFALLDDVSGGHKSKPKPWLSKVSVRTRHTPNKPLPCQYQPEEAHVIQQQVYIAPVQQMRIETVVDSHEVAKRYGGILILDYPKRKPVHKGFFY